MESLANSWHQRDNGIFQRPMKITQIAFFFFFFPQEDLIIVNFFSQAHVYLKLIFLVQ